MLITQAGSQAYNIVPILCHPREFCLLCLGNFHPPTPTPTNTHKAPADPEVLALK